MTGSRIASQTTRYRERLWVPWWWWPLAAVVVVVIGLEFRQGIPAVPGWVSFAALSAVAVGTLLWLGRTEVAVVERDGTVELVAGPAHLPISVITRTAEVPRTAKSAALGRQLDPAAFVVHRAWIGPMLLAVLDDPDDPTPYWLVSCRHPDRMLAALRS